MKTDSLSLRYAYNDLIKNRGVNAALFLILVISAFLMSTGAMVMERSVGSVDALFEQAKPPHFLQMHKGVYDDDTLSEFASQHPEIESWLIEHMLGFDGAAIAWRQPETGESGDFSGSLIDNLFVTQNEDFDFLIDQAGTIPRPSTGEVYVPVSYQQNYALRAGDELRIRTDRGSHDLTVRASSAIPRWGHRCPRPRGSSWPNETSRTCRVLGVATPRSSRSIDSAIPPRYRSSKRPTSPTPPCRRTGRR